MAAAQGGAISKRRKFVADGVFYAELNEFFQRELAEEGYSGVEVRVTPTVTDISNAPNVTLLLPLALIKENSHPRYPHARSPRRARTPYSRTHLPDSEALQVSRELRLPLRRQSSKPRSLRRRSVRVPPLQIAKRIGCATSLLWCSAIHHGEWSQGVRGRGFGETEGCES